MLNSGALQLTLFDSRDMASITSPVYPGERLVVCRNPDLAAERSLKREDLLVATERDLAVIKAKVGRKRDPLRGTAAISLAVGAVLNTCKMRKHFDLTITDEAFGFARKTAEVRPVYHWLEGRVRALLSRMAHAPTLGADAVRRHR